MAAVVFLTLDEFVALPLAVRAVRICDWSTVLPAAIAAMITIPFGAWVLASGDILTLRWAISLLALGLLILLASGWRYRDRPNLPVTLSVGAASGFLGGFAQISGPPIVAYWMSGPAPAAIIRANLIAYFLIISLASFAAYALNGFFSWEAMVTVLVLVPVYAFSIWLGAQGFARAGDRSYRPVAYVLIGLAALSSLPIFDPILR
jgi:uncharacterized membrane protein YfcA